MTLITEHQDSLPYIDRPLTPTSLSAANALIAAENPSSIPNATHPLLPPSPSPNFTPLIQSELERVAAKQPLTAIDLTRYEGASDSSAASTAEKEKDLQAAYTNAAYLTKRLQTLELLDSFGKNAWLVGNSQLEDVLRGVERELVGAREEVEDTERERREAQGGRKGEVEGLERGWREGVRGGLEVGVAVRVVEERIRERLREGAVAAGR